MKKTSKKIILGVFMACLCSCSNDVVEKFQEPSCMTRMLVTGNEASISNPTLINDWENIEKIALNSGERVTPPWSQLGSVGTLSETFRKDIKKEDGWKILFHTCKEVGVLSHLNYIFFYNQFTGYMKVFYYYESAERSQGTQWYIKTSNGSKVKLLDEPVYLTKPDSEPAANNQLLFSNMVQNPAYGVEKGWNGFEFPISRYGTDLTSMDFLVGAYDKTISEFNIMGNAEFSTVGTITTTSSQTPGIHNVVSNLAGPEAKKIVDKLGNKVFGDKVLFGKKIAELISSIPSSGFASAIKSGLNVIFGKTTTTSTSDVYLTTTGKITLGGTSSTVTTNHIPSLTFNLYDILNGVNKNNTGVVAVPTATTGHHLGVWTLEKNPVVYYERITLISNWQKIGETDNGARVIVKGHTQLPRMKRYEFNPIINPDLLPYIKNHSFSIEFIPCDKMEGKDYHLGNDINYYSGKTDIIYSDENLCLRETADTNKYHDMTLAVRKTNNIDPLCFYYDWGRINRGQLMAVVTLNMTCVIDGKEKEISQSQIYDVDYGTDTSYTQPTDVHHPPYVVVANLDNPYALANGLDSRW